MPSPTRQESKISPTARIMPSAHLEPGVLVEDQVVVGPNAVILGQDDGDGSAATTIRSEASIGANATVLPGVIIGIKAVVSPGAVVTRSVPPLAIVEGNPARIIGYVSTADASNSDGEIQDAKGVAVRTGRVRGVTLHRLRKVNDLRGNLSVGEFERDIPFVPKRFFLVFDVPSAETRGEHAHLECHQFLICVRGSCRVVADDGSAREEFVLDGPDRGLYLPPMTWGIQYRYTADAVLLAFASEYYDPDDYVRSYESFLKLARG